MGFMYSTHAIKDIKTVLAAVQKVQKDVPLLKVVSFGQELDNKQTYPANFEYHLTPSQDSIQEIYRSADCWVISSTSEGFYMPGIEAAACRCPLVSTRCGGPEDFIEDGISGHLVGIGDSDEMAERIKKILQLDNDSWQKMSEASYKISLNFDWDSSAEILEKALYKELAKGKNE